MIRRHWSFALALATLGLALLGLLTGSTAIPWSALAGVLTGRLHDPVAEAIVFQVRLPGVLTAMCAGAGSAICGLMLQTQFRNPLAGPGVLGISSGAGLGMALVMLTTAAWPTFGLPPDLVPVLASVAGAFAVLLIILAADRRVGDAVVLLIVGVMVGHLCSALVQVLQVTSHAAALKRFILWGSGSFAGVAPDRLPWLLVPVCAGVIGARLMVHPLNALLLGDTYAASLGIDVRRSRTTIIMLTAMMAGTITAFCGPVAFLGMATPHLARGLVRTADHRILLPATAWAGAALGLACDIIVRNGPVGAVVPLNAVTGLIGAPVVLWVLLNGRNWRNPARP